MGCRQGGDFTTNLATALLTLSRTRHLPKISLLHQNESTSAVQQRYSSVSVRSFTPASKNHVETSLGLPTRGRFHNKPRHCPRTLSLLPVAHPRPRCSTIASRRWPHSSATAPSWLLPAAVEVPPSAESQRACAAGGRGSAAERRVHVRGIARAHAAALEASLVRSHAHVIIKKRLARPCMEVFVAGAEDAFALHA